VLLLVAAARIAATRDIGTGVLPARDAGDPRLHLLSSATAQALRSERGSLIVWLTSVGAFAYIIGVIAEHLVRRNLKEPAAGTREARLGLDHDPSGYLALVFIFFVLAVSLFACVQIGGAAARRPGNSSRRCSLCRSAAPLARRAAPSGSGAERGAVPGGRPAELGGRRVGGASVSRCRGCSRPAPTALPVALLFLGIAALAYAVVPRASAGIAYGLVTVAFLWQSVRLAARRAEMARRTDAVRARRPRPGATVPRAGRRHHACAGGPHVGLGAVGVRPSRPVRRVA
jgi:ABC-2 type transport system permease protein